MQFLRKKRDFDWIFYNMYDNNSFSPFLLFFTESIFLFMFIKKFMFRNEVMKYTKSAGMSTHVSSPVQQVSVSYLKYI